jgi:hypothetical protein
MPNNYVDPSKILDVTDPGDELQRNIRYQNACGVIVLLRALLEKNNYVAVWCEHHDDYLGQRADGLYDGLQIKSRKPELGEWKITDEQLKKSIKKFVNLDKRFPGMMGDFYFVSNAVISDSEQESMIGKCPQKFVDQIKDVAMSGGEIDEKFKDSFENLRSYCGCTEEELKNTVLRLNFVKSPARDGFHDIISNGILAKLPHCAGLLPFQLDSLLDDLVQIIHEASSLLTTDPQQYWLCKKDPDDENPFLLAKRVSVEAILVTIQDQNLSPPIRLIPDSGNYPLIKTQKNLSILEQKFFRAELSSQLSTMKIRTLAAERKFFEMVGKLPADEFKVKYEQLLSVIKGRCDDAKLFTQEEVPPYGAKMLRSLLLDLKAIVDKQHDLVYRESYEFLVGIAGLLTEDCQVWWSEEFSLELVK